MDGRILFFCGALVCSFLWAFIIHRSKKREQNNFYKKKPINVPQLDPKLLEGIEDEKPFSVDKAVVRG